MIDFKELMQVVGELEENKIFEMINEFVASNPSEEEVQKAVASLQQGMAVVGDLYERGEYFVGDLIFAGELLREAINTLKPVIGSGSEVKIGSIVLGTVHGDLHDVGKNIFKSMAEATGFEVYDIGIDQPVSAFAEKVKEIGPDIVGMSGVLTLAINSMKDTVDELNKAGLRNSVKVIIGGNAITEKACVHIGADAFTRNAVEGVKISQKWVE